MEIGPIIGIRPIVAVKKAAASSPDLTGVFAIELRAQQDETYSPNDHRAARGLEDEASEADALVEPDQRAAEEVKLEPELRPLSSRKVSFFA